MLVVATGARLVPEETEGLLGPGWMDNVFTFYTPEGAAALGAALATFDRGRLVVNVVDMPIKCPVAPLEFCFLADWYFTERGIRDQVQITYATPLDGAFTKPIAAGTARRDARGTRDRARDRVQHRRGRPRRPADRLRRPRGPVRSAVVIPLHGGATYVGRSPGLGDELDFVPTDEHTLQSKAAPNIFVIGDAANVPASKAGSVTHFEGETLVGNVRRFLAGEPLEPGFDGHTNCFIETGFHKALLIDFNYDTEPQPGHYPTTGRSAAAEGVAAQPPRQAPVPVGVLARPAPRPRPPRPRLDHAHRGQAPARTAGGLTMPTATIAGVTVDRNDEGFFTDPDQWTEAMAPELARAEGIDELTDDHWRVIRFMRTEYAEQGHRTDGARARQDLGRLGQGALPAVPQGPGQDRRQDRRHPQAPRLHLKGSTP